ncbi:hypothetical protein FKM82_021625, partial [Ascaphus truei]
TDVLLAQICVLMKNSMHMACCLKNNREKERCLRELAVQESNIISNLTLAPDELCKLNKNGQLLTWIAYEYSRRNPSKPFNSNLVISSQLKERTADCCARNDTSLCLSHFYKDFYV